MRAGSMRHRVMIQQPVTTVDSFGAATTTWEVLRYAYASIEQMKSYDKSVAAATWPGADTTITLRYVPGVTGNMRIVHEEKVYSILGQPNNIDGRNREIICTCESGLKEC